MTETQTKSVPPRRRWLQVSLRTFLVLMLLVSVGLGRLGIVVQRGREQRRAVLAIGDFGGIVTYHQPANFLQRSDWLRKLFGGDAVFDVSGVYRLPGTQVTDAGVQELKVALPNCEIFY